MKFGVREPCSHFQGVNTKQWCALGKRATCEKSRVPHPRFLRVGVCVLMAQSILEHLAKYVLQDTAVMVVGNFFRSIDAGDNGELLRFSVLGFGAHANGFSRRQRSDALDIKNFMAGQAQ